MMIDKENPITLSRDWLIEMGWDKTQANNLVRAVRHEDKEKLWEIAPIWLTWAGEIKRAHNCILELAAMGLVSVSVSDDGKLLMQLTDQFDATRRLDPEASMVEADFDLYLTHATNWSPTWVNHLLHAATQSGNRINLVHRMLAALVGMDTGEIFDASRVRRDDLVALIAEARRLT